MFLSRTNLGASSACTRYILEVNNMFLESIDTYYSIFLLQSSTESPLVFADYKLLFVTEFCLAPKWAPKYCRSTAVSALSKNRRCIGMSEHWQKRTKTLIQRRPTLTYDLLQVVCTFLITVIFAYYWVFRCRI